MQTAGMVGVFLAGVDQELDDGPDLGGPWTVFLALGLGVAGGLL